MDTAERAQAQQIPVVMTFSGHDPTGGAGIQADIEALAGVGCHAAPVVTAITVQDTRDVARVEPLAADLVTAQARAVLADLPVAAFKIGLLGSAAVAAAVQQMVAEQPHLPLVLDPITTAGGGAELADDALLEALRRLLPRVTLLTPNSHEARRLAPAAADLDGCAAELLARGCDWVLVTGTHESGDAVVNRLYGPDGTVDARSWPRLDPSYHGSGCTLAAACAGLLAHGHDPRRAVAEAQAFTWESLRHGRRPGHGQHLPDRFFWATAARGRR
jgi:hydroxymethylpyrimidine/phosphomethylpyrimidine kinase